jgi:hypothetical protein
MRPGLLWLDYQVRDGRFPDVQDFMPNSAVAGKVAAGGQFNVAYTAGIRYAHLAAGYCVTEICPMVMPFVANPWWKGAT